ncbi:MAG: hypothetical protein IEMM0008_0564 [bacterium]|nr:MAG: hypothetical protein IEMM0008_0564 [bacterium]
MLTGQLYACFCGWNGPFIKMAKQSSYVVQVKIVKNDESMTMEAEIIENFKGEGIEENIVIGGLTSCDVRTKHFPVGSTWFFALEKGGTISEDDQSEEIEFYSISICGEYQLKVVKNKVIGQITNEEYRKTPQKMDLKAFKKLLQEELS